MLADSSYRSHSNRTRALLADSSYRSQSIMPKSKQTDGRAKSYQGDLDALTEILALHIRRPGAIQYPEKAGSRVNRDLIRPWSEMWRSLYALQENLSFSKAGMEAALTGVATTHRFFRKHPGNLVPFTQSVGARLRLMGRHIAQCKLKKARWAYVLLNLPLPDSSEEESAGEAPEADEDQSGQPCVEQEAKAADAAAETQPMEDSLGDTVAGSDADASVGAAAAVTTVDDDSSVLGVLAVEPLAGTSCDDESAVGITQPGAAGAIAIDCEKDAVLDQPGAASSAGGDDKDAALSAPASAGARHVEVEVLQQTQSADPECTHAEQRQANMQVAEAENPDQVGIEKEPKAENPDQVDIEKEPKPPSTQVSCSNLSLLNKFRRRVWHFVCTAFTGLQCPGSVLARCDALRFF